MRHPWIIRAYFGIDTHIRRAVLVCAGLCTMGTLVFMRTEGWDAWESFFFTLITLSTVGYGDHGITPTGERFAALLMIGGIGCVTYTIGAVVQYAAEIASNPERCMLKQIREMSDHVIVCGAGRTGQRIARKLVGQGVACVVIDTDDERIDALRNDGLVVLKGDASSELVLETAGIDRARGVAAVTSCDATNAMICLTTRAMCDKIMINARAEGEQSVSKLKRAGADSVINPSAYSGDGIVESLLRPEIAPLILGLDTCCGGTLRFCEIEITSGFEDTFPTIQSVVERFPRVVFVGLKHGESPVRVRPDVSTPLEPGDVLVVAGNLDEIESFFEQSGQKLAA